jgi:hypothetical protein
MSQSGIRGIDLFKIAGESISGWIPSWKMGDQKPILGQDFLHTFRLCGVAESDAQKVEGKREKRLLEPSSTFCSPPDVAANLCRESSGQVCKNPPDIRTNLRAQGPVPQTMPAQQAQTLEMPGW